MLVKGILIFSALAYDFSSIGTRIGDLGLSSQLLLYLGLLSVLSLCLWFTAMIHHPFVRWAWAVVFALAHTLVGSFQATTGDAMSYDIFITMIHSAGFAGDALAQHGISLAWPAAGALALMIGIGLKPTVKPRPPKFMSWLTPLAGMAMLTSVLFIRGGEGGRGLPPAWIGAAYSALYAIEMADAPSLGYQPIRIRQVRKPAIQDIVLIIDESIAGRYLDINDASGVRSGLAAPPSGLFVSNFGLAAAITNCSHGSNLTLRHGGTRADYQQMNATMPSIFAYAKKAGFETVYIDAQRVGGDYQNGMNDRERRAIDRFVQFAETPVVDRDIAAVDVLSVALGDDRRSFILVNKMGAHFPVSDKYPRQAQIYQPALPRDRTLNVTEMRLPSNLYVGTERWRQYRNSYRNTVAWTVGSFFDKLFTRANLQRALIIYTSDHGQYLHERGGAGTTTHCNTAPSVEEGTVPLVAIDAHGHWAEAAKRSFDASSHYRIFPTLLNAMGYDPPAVKRFYGESLNSPLPDPRTFNGRFNARLGRKPEWIEVQRTSVARPPASDFAGRKTADMR